jgi:hypothetical protein
MPESIPGVRQVGPEEARLVVAAGDERFSHAVDVAVAVAAEENKRVLAVGAVGSGKSTLCSIIASLCDLKGRDVIFVETGEDCARVARMAQSGSEFVAIAELRDDMPSTRRRSVFEAGLKASSCFVTATQLHAIEEHLSEGYERLVLLPPERTPAQLAAVADLVWVERLGLTQPLTATLTPAAKASLQEGPLPSGYHSLVTMLEALRDRLSLEGSIQESDVTTVVDCGQVNDALLDMLRTGVTLPIPGRRRLVIVVEGTTDVTYLTRAAQLFNAAWRTRVLESCDVEPPGDDRNGGATKVCQFLAGLASQHDAVALLDYDDPGRRALELTKKLGLRAITLPPEFARGKHEPQEVEIEDLLPLAFLESFYGYRGDLLPESRTTGGDGSLSRVLVKGEDKEAAAEFFADRATLAEAERIAYVVCVLWRMLGVPVDAGPGRDLGSWLRKLIDNETL